MSVLAAAAVWLVLGPQKAAYTPTGPKLEVVFTNGKKFVITTDPKWYPKTTSGITALVKKKFYDGQRFHRVEDWVVQWGDPLSKGNLDDPRVGSGGTGKDLPFEGGVVQFERGVVGIASKGGGRGGDCQLFVVKKAADWLYGQYAVLGKVTSGMDVIDNIQRGDKIARMTLKK